MLDKVEDFVTSRKGASLFAALWCLFLINDVFNGRWFSVVLCAAFIGYNVFLYKKAQI